MTYGRCHSDYSLKYSFFRDFFFFLKYVLLTKQATLTGEDNFLFSRFIRIMDWMLRRDEADAKADRSYFFMAKK